MAMSDSILDAFDENRSLYQDLERRLAPLITDLLDAKSIGHTLESRVKTRGGVSGRLGTVLRFCDLLLAVLDPTPGVHRAAGASR